MKNEECDETTMLGRKEAENHVSRHKQQDANAEK